MKKYKIVLGCLTLALTACGVAACGDKTDSPSSQNHTVSFENAWGGVPADQTVVHNDKANRPEEPAERLGWHFDGWYLGDVEYTFTEAVKSDITLVAKYSSVLGGDGTQANPFTIDNADELLLLKGYIDEGAEEFISANYIQTADITSTLTAPLASFAGVYDGGGKTLTTGVPMIESLTGAVKNITVGGNITVTGARAGIVANSASGATEITRVTTSGSITNASGTVGGVVGILNSGRIEYVTANAAVNGKTAGGIVGESKGTVINSISSASVTATETAGGAVGVEKSGALIQNVGFGGAVNATNAAGGIVGKKESGSAVFRGFVYGNGTVDGETAGGIVGSADTDVTKYSDIADSYVLNSVTIDGAAANIVGANTVEDLSGLSLPNAVWNMNANVPTLRSQLGNAPSTVTLTVNGNNSSVAYGYNIKIEAFTGDDAHFSRLIEIDTDVELWTVESVHTEYDGVGFTAAYSEIEFTSSGMKYKATQNGDFANLTYVITFAHTSTFEYTPDFSNPNNTQEIEYAAPVSIYTDGQKYYAFTVEKQQIQSGYVAFMESYVMTDSGWRHNDSWFPKADIPVGAYTYTTAFSIGTSMKHFVLVGGDYTVEDGFGYYITRYMPRYIDTSDNSYTDGDYTVGRGYTVMFLGDSETNEFTTAFAFEVNYEGYVDFIYIDENDKLISSTGSPVTDATTEFLGGVWFDGTNKYEFDTENNNVSAVGGETAPYTVANGVISFTLGGTKHELTLTPTLYGACMLVSKNGGDDFTAATYISGAFDGEWITEDGDIITVSSEPAAAVTFNGDNAQANEALYNGVQAIRFTVDDKEYHLVTFREDGVALLYLDNVAVYAMEKTAIDEMFVGSFVSVEGGVRYEFTVADDFTVTLKDGDSAAKTGQATPVRKGHGKYGIAVAIGSATYDVLRTDDVLIVEYGDKSLVFTDSDIFARFVVEYTNGREILEITDNGTFARYARGGSATGYVNLTAKYREERVAYGREDRGFVLSYTVDGTEYFFYADVDAANIRLYRSFVNSNGNETARDESVFVPESALISIFGSYTRTFNDQPDTLTFGVDYKLTRTYKDGNGTQHTDEEINWYPVLNYNYNTQKATLSANTYEVEADGTRFDNNITFTTTGLTWGLNSYITAAQSEVFELYTKPVYINDSTSITVGAERITVKSIAQRASDNELYIQTAQYAYDACILSGDTVTLTMTETGLGITDPRTATAVLSKDGETLKVTLTVDGGSATVYEGQDVLDYNTLVGEYENDGTTYAFTVDESWFGTTIKLTLSGSKKGTYNYTASNGSVVMTDGTQALSMGRVNGSNAVTLYVWKDGDSLMISESLDPSDAIAATDTAIAGMPSLDDVKAMLDGNTYTAADGSTVSFETVSGLFDTSFVINDGDDSAYLDASGHIKEKGVYTLMFGVSDSFASCVRYVKVYINDAGLITKLLVGATLETATKEYLPSVVYPTVNELQALLDGQKYIHSTDKTQSVSFEITAGIFGDQFNATVIDADGDEMGYAFDKGTQSGNVYTLEFSIGFTKANIMVTLNADGTVEKIEIDDEEYLPITLPTVDELQTLLDGQTFVHSSDSTQSVSFEITAGIFGDQFNATVIDADGDEMGYAFDKGTKNDRVYTLEFSIGFTKANIIVTLKADGTVEKIEIDGEEYLPE